MGQGKLILKNRLMARRTGVVTFIQEFLSYHPFLTYLLHDAGYYLKS
jgi:hypothetical protein